MERGAHPSFHPGRCARVTVEGREIGYLGELHPLVCEAFDLPVQPVVALEWDLEALLDAARAAEGGKHVGMISAYPPVHEDLALIVDAGTPALDVQRAILQAGLPLVTRALLFDIYQGPQVGEGKKSLAFALTYQSPGKALDESDVEKLRMRIIKVVEKQLGAKVRRA